MSRQPVRVKANQFDRTATHTWAVNYKKFASIRFRVLTRKCVGWVDVRLCPSHETAPLMASTNLHLLLRFIYECSSFHCASCSPSLSIYYGRHSSSQIKLPTSCQVSLLVANLHRKKSKLIGLRVSPEENSIIFGEINNQGKLNEERLQSAKPVIPKMWLIQWNLFNIWCSQENDD